MTTGLESAKTDSPNHLVKPLPFMMKVFLGAMSLSIVGASTPESLRSPENQVFQFAYSGTCTNWPDGSATKSTGYLWIPENCPKIRGLVIFCTNVPEHLLVNHPAIRQACERNSLGIAWFVPTFWNFNGFKGLREAAEKEGEAAKTALQNNLRKMQVGFFQQMLDGLANVSGYREVASVPWLPMGESGHLLMVTGLVDEHPERCIAAVCIKNPQYPKDRTVPMLWTLGTAQEWGQKKSDVRKSWLGQRGWGRDATWPLSALIEPGSGHFFCTDRMAAYFGKYIDAMAKVRLPSEGAAGLKPVDLESGFLAWLPSPKDTNPPVSPYKDSPPGDRNRLWFQTEELAREAQDFSRVNWEAKTQMPTVEAAENCTVDPFVFQDSISKVNVSTDSEFALKGVMLPSIPQGFEGQGEPLSTTDGTPCVNWICGPVAPLGNNRFRISLDRTWKSAACYLAAVQQGTPDVRYALQPLAVNLQENREGKPQIITFENIPDIKDGTGTVPLTAKSDSGLPVSFYVESGPAIVKGNSLILTKAPPGAAYPVAVTVAAWQWGRNTEPKTQTAPVVKQTFHLLKN
jgi:hypothetical protein